MFFRRKKPDTLPTAVVDTPADAPVTATTLATADTAPVRTAVSKTVSDTIQLVEEQAVVGKLAVPGDTVRVSTEIDTAAETVSLDVRRENYNVQRVPHNTVVTTIPEIRREDGLTIIPVLEERAVVVKQLVLVEEIHITEDHRVETVEETVTLRKQRAVVERESAD